MAIGIWVEVGCYTGEKIDKLFHIAISNWCQEEFDIFSKSIAQIFLGGIAFWDKFGYCWGGHKDKLHVASNDWLAQGRL